VQQELFTLPWHLSTPPVFIGVGVPYVQQELFTLPWHLSTPPVFIGVGVGRSLVFYTRLCRSLFVLWSFLEFVVSVLRFAASDYPVGIFKLFT